MDASKSVKEAREVVMRNIGQFSDGLVKEFHKIDDAFRGRLEGRSAQPQQFTELESESMVEAENDAQKANEDALRAEKEA